MILMQTVSVVSCIMLNISTPLKRILISLLLCIVFFECTGQIQAKITQPQLTLVNDSLIINYHILDANPNERFDIRLEITDATGAKINAVTLAGDIGDTIMGGVNKQIIWNLAADSIFLNTAINVELVAKKIIILETVAPEIDLAEVIADESKEEEDLDEIPADESKEEKDIYELPVDESKEEEDLKEITSDEIIEEKDIAEISPDQGKVEEDISEIPSDESKEEKELTEIPTDEVTKEDISDKEESSKVIEEPAVTAPKVKTGKHILQSAIFPGWGLTEMSKGKPYWLIGVAGTGCIASSIYFNRKAYSNYDNYLESNDREKSNTYFDNAKTQDNISKALVYTAAAIWVTDLVIVGVRAGNLNKSYRKNSLSAFSIGSYIESNTDTPMLSLYFNF
ncbi:MAG: hypothetical protein JSV22_03360 [Bacteroidales bacterium]|nr:MAG: hypothetical protein JSV22_03360 [Bacteroidales bacterium]